MKLVAGVLTCCGMLWTGTPNDSGIALQVVSELGKDIPLLGVCMGHQCIGQAFGGMCLDFSLKSLNLDLSILN